MYTLACTLWWLDLFIQIKKDQTVGNRLMHGYVFSPIVKGHEIIRPNRFMRIYCMTMKESYKYLAKNTARVEK